MHKLSTIGGSALVLALFATPVSSRETGLFHTAAAAQAGQSYARFTPRKATSETRIDYSHWDEALKYFVYRMGRSIREGAPRVEPALGSRFIFGHDSRLRLEGNRVAFSFLEQEQIDALTAYREDLERTADLVDISALPRNEQLAYWMNLHNVAVIEQIAKAYPVQQPSRINIGPDRLPLDQAKIVTVSGVALSPHDIRTRIVFPNWRDPRVIYGFFRGEIGGPSIQREAFAANKVGTLLDEAAFEFVNSLRGTEKRGETLHVSKIYEEAAPHFFRGGDSELRDHLRKYATDRVGKLIDRTSAIKASIYEKDISDLARGERDPEHGLVTINYDPTGLGRGIAPPIGVPRHIGRLVVERQRKYRKIRRRASREGWVIFLTPEQLAERDKANREIE